MQLREFLDNEGAGKINVIAINWTETAFGVSEARLRRFMGLMPEPNAPSAISAR